MATSNRLGPRRLGDGVRRKLEVTSALAWESLVDTHVEQATQFIHLLEDHEPVQQSLPRYLSELDINETMGAAIRTRVLVQLEDEAGPGPRLETDAREPARPLPSQEAADPERADDDSAWGLLRHPQRVVQDVIRRQRRNDEAERIALLALARAEEHVIRTHVENAISFVALLQDQMPMGRAVQEYLTSVGLSGGRAQAVFQRTMAKLADVHLPV
jgi:hypothetical protein